MAKGHSRSAKRSGKGGSTPNIPPAELDVLGVLWQNQKATARSIREAMKPFRPMTHGAVVALLTRLEGKKMVCKEKGNVGKAFIYEPTRGPEGTYRRIMKAQITRLFGGSVSTLVAAAFDAQKPSTDDLRRIQSLLR